MSKILTLILALIFTPGLRAQSLDAFKQQLSAPVTSEGSSEAVRVLVSEYGDAAQAVNAATQKGARLRFKGYRVCIFFDNGQDARGNAQAAITLFESTFPGVRTYFFYETPYFKVTVGNCVTAEEAIILMEKVRGAFPKAFLKNEELVVNDLIR